MLHFELGRKPSNFNGLVCSKNPVTFSPVRLTSAGKTIIWQLPKTCLGIPEALLGSLPGKSGVALAALLFCLNRTIPHSRDEGARLLRTVPAVCGMDSLQEPSPLLPFSVRGGQRAMNMEASAQKHAV